MGVAVGVDQKGVMVIVPSKGLTMVGMIIVRVSAKGAVLLGVCGVGAMMVV